MQNFTVGQEVAILDYEDRRSGRKTYETGFFFKGRFAKNPSYSSWSRGQKEYIAKENGTYVFVQKADSVYACGHCDGAGFIYNIPETADQSQMTEAHRNYYRQSCTGYGCVNGQRTEPGRGKFIIDRKDKVMSIDDYAPILAAKHAAELAERVRQRARNARIAGRVQELVDFLPTLLTEGNKELALANFLNEGGRLSELGTSIREVIEKNKPECSVDGCHERVNSYTDGMCYSHWSIAQAAEREGQSVVA